MPDLNLQINSAPAPAPVTGPLPPAPPPPKHGGGGVSTSNVPPPPPPFGTASAPYLAPASLRGIDLDSIQMWSASNSAKVSDQQAVSGKQNAETMKFAKEAIAQRVQQLIDQANQAAKDAQASAETNKIINWVITIGVTVGVVGLTLATGGGALAVGLTAFMGATSVVGMVLQQMDVQVNSPSDGQKETLDFSIPGAVNAAIDALVGSGAIVQTHEENGKTVDNHGNEVNDAYRAAHPNALIVDAGELSTIKMVAGIAASIIIEGGIGKVAVNSMAKAAKAAQAAQGAEGLETIQRSTSKLERLGQAMTAAGLLTQGGGTIASGKVSLEGAEANLSKDQANTEKDYQQGEQQVLTQKSKRQLDATSKAWEDSLNVLAQISESIAGEYQLSERIAKINVS
jgi:hypothetical protein